MSRRRWLAFGWLVVLAFTAFLPLRAIVGGIFHVGTGTVVETRRLDRPLISIGSTVDLRSGASSIVVVLFGDVHVAGSVADDVVNIDGRVYLGPRSTVQGDVLSILGGIYRASGAQVSGRLGGALYAWDGRPAVHHHNLWKLVGSSVRLGLAAGLALLLAGTCLTVVFPWQIVLISGTVRGAPLQSTGAGIMALLTFAFLVVPLGLSLAGLPFALLLTAAGSLAWLFGMTSAAVILGRFVARGRVSLLWAATAGLVVLALAMAVPVVGPIAVALIGLVGAGALAVALIGRARPSVAMPETFFAPEA